MMITTLALVAHICVGQVSADAVVAPDSKALIQQLAININKVDHAIEVTRDLVLKSSDSPYLADLLCRLAELYIEKSRYIFARSREQQSGDERIVSDEKSFEVRLNKKLAIEIYDRILADFPEYERNDQVRFFRAHEFRELGEWDAMLNQFDALIQKYPASEWTAEARIIVGDHYYDKNDMDGAAKYYGSVLSLKSRFLKGLANYMMGWVRINQEKFAQSLKFFEAATAEDKDTRKGHIGSARTLDVATDSLVSMALPYSETRKAEDAPAYFRALAPTKAAYLAALKRLANRYFVKTQLEEAALIYREDPALLVVFGRDY